MDCFVCEKHRQRDRAQGGVLFEDDLLYAGHVYSFVHGDAVPHLHLHLIPRYAGTHVPPPEQVTRT